MKREESAEFIQDFFRAMNDHDVEKMGKLCTEGIVAEEVAEPEPFVGLDAFKKAYSELFEGYPDCVAKVEEMFIDGNAVICQVRWGATNAGAFRGAGPTGKKVDIPIAYFFRLRGGKIERITEYYDLASVLVQQGNLDL